MIQIISASDQFIATHLICVWIVRPFVAGRGARGMEMWGCGDWGVGGVQTDHLAGCRHCPSPTREKADRGPFAPGVGSRAVSGAERSGSR
jgi:hypothetical protein